MINLINSESEWGSASEWQLSGWGNIGQWPMFLLTFLLNLYNGPTFFAML